MTRLRTDMWVSAYLRRCNLQSVTAVLRRRGAAEAGAIFVKIDRLDGTGDLFGPVPQAAYDDAGGDDRQFVPMMTRASVADIEDRMLREIRFDEDLWLVELESRAGDHFLNVPPEGSGTNGSS